MDTLLEGVKRLRIGLDQRQVEAFRTYEQELLAEGPRASLTAVRDSESIQSRHFLESLALLVALEEIGALGERAIDIGTGAGFPGLPIKIVRPQLRLTLLEATGKKAAFLERLVQRLRLREVTVVHGRAEELAHDPAHRQAYDLALARALSPLPTLVELALGFLRRGGFLAAPKGSRAPREVREAAAALAACGGAVHTVRSLHLPGAGIAPTLVVIRKVSDTPERFPRRPGIPAKRPLR